MATNTIPGYRFNPTEQQLITHYLTPKSKKLPLPCDVVQERQCYLGDPWVVFDKEKDPWLRSKLAPGKKHMYVFTNVTKKKQNATAAAGKRGRGKKSQIVRVAGCGTWDSQTGLKPIYDDDDDEGRLIGFKRSLVFEIKDSTGVDEENLSKGYWSMHEYSLCDDSCDWVLCKIVINDSKAPNRPNDRNRMKKTKKNNNMCTDDDDEDPEQQPEEDFDIQSFAQDLEQDLMESCSQDLPLPSTNLEEEFRTAIEPYSQDLVPSVNGSGSVEELELVGPTMESYYYPQDSALPSTNLASADYQTLGDKFDYSYGPQIELSDRVPDEPQINSLNQVFENQETAAVGNQGEECHGTFGFDFSEPWDDVYIDAAQLLNCDSDPIQESLLADFLNDLSDFFGVEQPVQKPCAIQVLGKRKYDAESSQAMKKLCA